MEFTGPAFTPLQFAVATVILRHRVVTGRKLRQELADEGIDLTGPAFYQFMNRLQKSGLVELHRNLELERDLAVKETSYSLSDEGKEAYRDTLDFFRSRAQSVAPQQEGDSIVGSALRDLITV